MMFYKPSLFLFILMLYLIQCESLILTELAAQNSAPISPTPITSDSSNQITSNLITNNPFVPSKSMTLNELTVPEGPKGAVNKSQILQKYLEFKSIAIINKKKYFSIFNKRTNKPFWISENETVNNFSITNYNKKTNTITISDGINTELITIIDANEAPLSVASAALQPKKQESINPPLPEANSNKNNKSKTPPRRRIVSTKR